MFGKFPNEHHKEIIGLIIKISLYGGSVYFALHRNDYDKVGILLKITQIFTDTF